MSSNYKYSTRSPTGLAKDEPDPIEAAGFPDWFVIDYPSAAEWVVDADRRPRLSHHVIGGGGELGRWQERTPWWACSPEAGFDSAVQITSLKLSVFEDARGDTPDRVYVTDETKPDGVDDETVERYGMVFMVCDDNDHGPAEPNGVCVTCYRISNSRLKPWVKSYLWELLTHVDGGDVDD